MGVPAFYRWLVNKYPQVVVKVVDHKTNDHLHQPNVNADDGFVFDNLYLDMNGIIHPCFHPADADDDADHLVYTTPTTFDQVFENIYAYIDRLLRIARPRNLLYVAIDGVAPRAKMNQQRSRRFRAAKDYEIAEEEERKLREEFESKGKTLLPKLHTQLFDSNVITPGTEFMHDLSKALNLYVLRKLNNNDPAWTHLKVIISDATVPGEGEHKIVSFNRSKRTLLAYDPNTTHCLYGLDADLIMLALATHELYFTVLREDVLSERKEAPVSDSTRIKKAAGEHYSLAELSRDKKQYEFVHVWILREYLELDMQIDDQPEKFVYDVERIIDDFIFISFFVGNDFLPHMPTLEIHEKAIDLLMYVYKKEFRSLGGYLVDMQRVNDKHASYIKLKRVEKFILSVGTYEERIFKKRADIRERKLRRIMRELLLESEEADEIIDPHEGFEVNGIEQNDHDWGTAQKNNTSSDTLDDAVMLENTKEFKEKLKKSLRQKSDIFRDGNLGRDKVKLGSEGWKQRYYKEKFLVENSKDVESMRKDIVQKYTEGLCWVLLYYFHGITSWNWYYPYHHGPFASDLRGLAGVKVRFEKGSPFRPFDN